MARPVWLALLQLDLPEPHPGAVAAAAIGGDQQAFGLGVAFAAHASPPAADAFDGEAGGVMIDADADPAFIGGNVVDAVGNSFAVGLDHEVVDTHLLGLALGAQFTPGVLEVVNQLLLLGIDRDRRLSGAPKARDGGVDMLELGIAVGMMAALARLGVGLQAEAHVLQQAPDHGVADAVAPARQFGRQMPLAAAHPQQVRLRVATDRRADQLAQRLEQAGLLDHRRLAAAAAAPYPTARPSRPSLIKIPQPAPDRAARNAGHHRDRRDPATARRPGLAGGKQPQPSLVQMRRDPFVAQTNGDPVDHTASLRFGCRHATTLAFPFLRCSTSLDSILAIR